MKFRNLDANGDWTWGAGLGNYAINDQAIGLNIQTRVLSWVNDCFFDMTAGIDWYTRLGTRGQRELLETELRRIILQSSGVTGLISFDTILNGRNFSANYNITTIYSAS